jgi:adenylate cyclase
MKGAGRLVPGGIQLMLWGEAVPTPFKSTSELELEAAVGKWDASHSGLPSWAAGCIDFIVERPVAKLLPVCLTAAVIGAIFLIRSGMSRAPALNLAQKVEWFTYDWRARLYLNRRAAVDPELAVIYIDENSIRALNQDLGKFRWPWPRSVYGKVIGELKSQGAAVIGMDAFIWERESDPPESELGGLTPDEFLAQQMAAAGNVVIPTVAEDIRKRPIRLKPVLDLFRTNVWGLAQDGCRDLSPCNSGRLRSVTAFLRDPESKKPVWQLGILMAARMLDLDLSRAVVQPGRILLPSRKGPALEIPVDGQGQFFIPWTITHENSRELVEAPFAAYYAAALQRERGAAVEPSVKGKLVLIGHAASGNRVSDWGATAVAEVMPQCLAHLNVANALLTGRFITPAPPWLENALIAGMAVLSALMGWRLRVSWGVAAFATVVAVYLLVAARLFTGNGYWLPIAAPLGGSFLMGYVCLLSYRVVVERQDQRRVRNVFGKMVSPNIFNLLVKKPASALDSARRNVTIYFADVRGFTRFLEENHTRILKRLKADNPHGRDPEVFVARGVHESLETVNRYLGEIADVVKAHDGTLDKYIGDCVMTFWGAPVPDERHAVAAVRAAIAVHRALHALNLGRLVENERRQQENIRRLSAGEPVLEPLPVLRVGSALNSGAANVGFMGSPVHVSNYTVFGREVNIASRLEAVVEPDCIFITEATFAAVNRFDPKLAATFIKRGSAILPGIAGPVQIYEVPWQPEQGEGGKPVPDPGTQPEPPAPRGLS